MPRPQALGQGRTVPRPRNLALRPRINIPDLKKKMKGIADGLAFQY